MNKYILGTCHRTTPSGLRRRSGQPKTNETIQNYPFLSSVLLKIIALLFLSLGEQLRADTLNQTLRSFGWGTIEAVALSADGAQLATAGTDGLFLRDFASGRLIRSWAETNVGAIAFTPNGKQILVGYGRQNIPSETQPARIWDTTTGNLVLTLDAAYTALAFSKDGTKILTGRHSYTTDGYPTNAKAILWDASTGQKLVTLAIGSEYLVSVAISSDGTRAMTAGSQIHIWELPSGNLLQSFGFTNNNILSAAWSPDGTKVLTGEYGNPVITTNGEVNGPSCVLWDAVSGQILQEYDAGQAGVKAVAFSPDGMQVFAGTGSSWDYAASVIQSWDTASDRHIKDFVGHACDVIYLAFNSDGSQLVSAGGYFEGWTDYTVKVWDAANGNKLRAFGGHAGAINSAAISADGTKVVMGSPNGSPASFWDAGTGDFLGNSDILGWMASVAISADGCKALLMFRDSAFYLVDAASGSTLRQIGDANAFSDIGGLSTDGHRVIFWSLTTPSNGQLWNADDDTLLKSYTNSAGVIATDISRDGALVVTADSDLKARLWDSDSGAVLTTFSGHTSPLTAIALSADKSKVATASKDGTARLWDAQSGQSLLILSGHIGAVNCVALSADGRWVLTGGADKTARLWDRQSGQLVRTMAGNNNGVTMVGISADGTKVLTQSNFDKPRLWDTSDLTVQITVRSINGTPTLKWVRGALQQRSSIDGQWSDIAGALSPYPIQSGARMQFYRVKVEF